MAPKICQKMVKVGNNFFVKKLKILCSSDHPILFKFQQLVVKILIKELQNYGMLDSNISNSNGDMEELRCKI